MPRGRSLHLLLGVVLAGSVLRLWSLGERSLWYDEVLTVFTIEGGLSDVAGRLTLVAGPPLYPLLAWAWASVAGTGEVGLRLLPALLGVAAIPVAWACGARLAGPRAGTFTAVLAAASPLLVWHSQDARAYSLLILLTALGFLAFLRALEDPCGRAPWAWAAASAAALTAHYDAAFVIAAQTAWLVAAAGAGGARRRALAASAAVGAVGVALVPLALAQVDVGPSLGANSPRGGSQLAGRLAGTLAQFVTGYQPEPQVPVVAAGALLVLAAAVTGAWGAGAARLRRLAPALVVGAAGLALPAVLALVGPDHLLTRYLVGAWVPLAVALGAALALTRLRVAAVAVCAALAAFGVAVTLTTAGTSKFQHEAWRDALAAAGDPDVLVITPARGDVVIHHYRRGRRIEAGAVPGVTEIAVIALPPAFRRPGRSPRPPDRAAPAPPAGFRLDGTRRTREYVVLRYRSDRERPVTVPAFRALGLTASPPSVFAPD